MNRKGLIQFRFVELFTGNNVANIYHVVKTEKGTTIAAGNSNNDGLSVWISRDVGDTLLVYVKSLLTGELKEKARHTVIYKKEKVRILTSKILLDNISLIQSTNSPGKYQYSTHKVKAGETLTSISKHYGCKMEVIVQINKLSNPDEIKIGQIIKIPYKSNINNNDKKKKDDETAKSEEYQTNKSKDKTEKNRELDEKKLEKQKQDESVFSSIFKRIEAINIFNETTQINGKPMGVAQNATSACLCKEYNLAWGNKVNCEFRKKVIQIAKNLWPDDSLNMASQLMAVMHLESAGTFSPSIGTFTKKNLKDDAKGGYVGLIQFGKNAAIDLDVKRSDLAKLSAVNQLDYVEKYYLLRGANKKIKSLTGLYLWVNYPKNVNENRLNDEDIVYSAPKDAEINTEQFKNSPYHQNPSFMKEDGEFVKTGKNITSQGIKNGSTKVWEVEKEIKKHLTEGLTNVEVKYSCEYGNASNTNNSKIDINIFANTLKKRAEQKSIKACARYVRIALEAAGADTTGHPIAASDWGATLLKNGYKEIPEEFSNPQKGDIYIITKTKKHIWGHIAGFDGNQWISDFKQKSQIIYSDKVSYRYFRL